MSASNGGNLKCFFFTWNRVKICLRFFLVMQRFDFFQIGWEKNQILEKKTYTKFWDSTQVFPFEP